MNGWYEIEIGLPNSWVFDDNNEIKCEIISKSDAGKLIKVVPKNEKIVIDDLISFVEIIIETNEKIAEKEKEFTNKMEQMKGMLESEAKKFYEELDELKSNSFKKHNDNFVKELQSCSGEKKQRRSKNSKENSTETVKQGEGKEESNGDQ
jgi:uncharacterized protein with von Willebrand factor type A (vWA) domain